MEPDAAALRLFRAARWVGALLLAAAVPLLRVMPAHAGRLPPGLRTPIVAIELARTRDEVEAIFGPPGSDLRAELVRRVDLGNQIDFAFMLLYGGLLLLMGLAFARLYGRRYLPVAWLAPLAALCDALENSQLFSITGALGARYDHALARLGVFTWLKWGGLALALTWLAPALLRGSRTERVVAVPSTLAGLLAVGAFFDRARFAEAFALCVSVAFVGLFVVSLQRGSGGIRPAPRAG